LVALQGLRNCQPIVVQVALSDQNQAADLLECSLRVLSCPGRSTHKGTLLFASDLSTQLKEVALSQDGSLLEGEGVGASVEQSLIQNQFFFASVNHDVAVFTVRLLAVRRRQ